MTATHCAVSDVTPTRCTIQATGTADECRSACEDRGDATWRVMHADSPIEPGTRAHHADGRTWSVGRPRLHVLPAIRCTSDELAEIRRLAAAARLTVSEYVRRRALKATR